MAVVSLNTSTFTQVADGSAAVLVQFRAATTPAGPLLVQVASSASPTMNDWIEMARGDVIRFPVGTAVFARAVNVAGYAVTRAFA